METTFQPSLQTLNWKGITVQVNKASQKLRAFNHRLRQQLLIRLEAEGPQTVTQLYTHFLLEQSVASQQLGVLRRAGLVKTHREGKHIYYALNREAVLSLYCNATALNED